MRTLPTILASLAIACCLADHLVAQQYVLRRDQPSEQSAHPQIELDQIPLETKRQWVRTQMVREFADSLDESLLAEIERKVAAMAPQRIDQMVENYLRRQQIEQQVTSDEARIEQLQDEARRELLIRQYQARLAAARGGSRSGGRPGFAPVITTLPSGTQLGATAVVSPDRRYVRMSLAPFFSSVGPVQTFTFRNPTPFGSGHRNNQPRQVRVPWRGP